MSKVKTNYVCQNCGYKHPKWLGRCTDCNEFNTMVEEVERQESRFSRPVLSDDGPVPISEVQPHAHPRMLLDVPEVDRVLGGGIVKGSVMLIGGDPGIGKSTLLLQIAQKIASTGEKVLYVSAEESVMQTKLRADRLGVNSPNLYIVSESDLNVIKQHIETVSPTLGIIDSIQMIYRSEIPSAPGTVTQVRECTTDLVYTSKRRGMSLFIIGHVTKDGAIAGPRTLEHLVDAVFYFEGDRYQTFRLLRAVKNRYGSTNEIGLFDMQTEGLVGVSNPSELFMTAERKDLIGSVVVPSIIGSRTLLVEIQALAARSSFGVPARRVTGVDFNRVAMILAVLERKANLNLGMQDVFVNAVGGVQVDEPAVDLGIAVAVASSVQGRAVDAHTLVIGELGLAGEVRHVTQINNRVQEAKRLGFKTVIVPKMGLKSITDRDGIELIPVAHIKEALQKLDIL